MDRCPCLLLKNVQGCGIGVREHGCLVVVMKTVSVQIHLNLFSFQRFRINYIVPGVNKSGDYVKFYKHIPKLIIGHQD